MLACSLFTVLCAWNIPVWAIFSGIWKIKNKTKCSGKYRQLILITKWSHPLLCCYFSQTDCFTITVHFLQLSYFGSCHFWSYNISLGGTCPCLSKSSHTEYIMLIVTVYEDFLYKNSFLDLKFYDLHLIFLTIHYHVVILYCSSKQTLILCPFSTSLFFYHHQ